MKLPAIPLDDDDRRILAITAVIVVAWLLICVAIGVGLGLGVRLFHIVSGM